MMMNFIAAAIASYVTLELIKNPESQNPESRPISADFMFRNYDFVQSFFKDSPANFSLLIAIVMALVCYFFLFHTVWGYEIRSSGKNEKASEIAGIPSRKMKILAMTLAGALAGGVALNEVLGSTGRYKMGFSPDYGFVGIAVALLARNNPLGVLASAFLFGVLQKGATDLDIETEFITRDFARIIQAILIFSVASSYFIKVKPFWKKEKK
jgi:simple sugar transport system permease protein